MIVPPSPSSCRRRVGAGDVTASDAPDTTPDEVPPSAGDTVDRNDDPDGAMTVPGLAAEGDCDPEGSPGRRPDVDPMAVLDDLDRAVWIYDPERHCLVWGKSRRPGPLGCGGCKRPGGGAGWNR